MRSIITMAFIVAFTALAGTASGAASKLETLSIAAASGIRTFEVEVVREERDRNRGLMFRRHMDAGHGMLFDYDPPVVVAFWMKNTYIPLDIIFVDVEGRIIRIAANTTPHSLEHIPSGGEARAVLEINGGLAEKLGIKVGDRVQHPLFKPQK